MCIWKSLSRRVPLLPKVKENGGKLLVPNIHLGFLSCCLREEKMMSTDRSSTLVMHHSKMHRKKGALNLKKCNTINSFIDVHNGTLHRNSYLFSLRLAASVKDRKR